MDGGFAHAKCFRPCGYQRIGARDAGRRTQDAGRKFLLQYYMCAEMPS